MQTTYVDDLAVLTELVTTGNDLDAVKIHLFTAGPTLTPNMTLGDFTEAVSVGLTAKTVTWGTPFVGGGGLPEVDTQLLIYIVTTITPETILGWYMTDSGGTAVKAADYFASPVPLSADGQGVAFVIGYRRFDGVTTQVA